ncbi:hypothetical protein BC332_30371 [Capsicum chinense]|nr:hypothetical protein BC332_30371 [Capsicum chinense]
METKPNFGMMSLRELFPDLFQICDNPDVREAPETKRKTIKRTFKSEKEFLEFTLKYQQVLAERDSAIAVRDKLESLCRELQRQNKVLLDECKRVSSEGQNLRLDLSDKFQDAIKWSFALSLIRHIIIVHQS